MLGVNIDNTLSWTFQVENTVKKCNSLLYLLNRINCYLTIPVRKLFHNAYILPHLDYCCIVWGKINNNLTDTLVKFQKRAARIILDRSIDTPSADLFAELNWMTFPERVKYQKAVLMFKIMNTVIPSYLNNLYSYTPGPGCSKLTTSLVNVSLKFLTLISQICQYFLLKKCEKLLQCKSFSHIVNKNISVFGYKVVKHLTS